MSGADVNMSSESFIKKKGPNYTPMELEVLIFELEERKGALYGTFNSSGKRTVPCARVKGAVYHHIEKALDGIGPVKRLAQDIRRKKECLFSKTKKKASIIAQRRRQTGGGGSDAEELSPMEERILRIMGETVVHGITGGRESASRFPVEVVPLLAEEGNEGDGDMAEPAAAELPVEDASTSRPQKKRKVSRSKNSSATLSHFDEQILQMMSIQNGLLERQAVAMEGLLTIQTQQLALSGFPLLDQQ